MGPDLGRCRGPVQAIKRRVQQIKSFEQHLLQSGFNFHVRPPLTPRSSYHPNGKHRLSAFMVRPTTGQPPRFGTCYSKISAKPCQPET